jgi:hypothetical protein
MLDTVRLFTKEFELAKKNSFVTQTTANYSTGEIMAEKVFCNLGTGARLNIKPQGNEKCLFFEASLPKLIYKSSLTELKEDDLERCIEAVADQFKVSGAVVDFNAIERLPLSRLDYCRNIQVKHAIVDYLALLRNCSFGKRNKTNWQTETVLFFNGSQEFTAYNKVLEVKSSKYATVAGVDKDTPEDILRLESRLKSAAVVKRILHQRRTLGECFNFDMAKEKLLNDFDTLVLNVGSQLELNFNSDLERLQALRERSRYGWRLFLSEQGVDLFLLKYGYDLELVKKLLLEAFSRRQTYNILKELKLFIAERRTPEQRDLLKELRFKLAA